MQKIASSFLLLSLFSATMSLSFASTLLPQKCGVINNKLACGCLVGRHVRAVIDPRAEHSTTALSYKKIRLAKSKQVKIPENEEILVELARVGDWPKEVKDAYQKQDFEYSLHSEHTKELVRTGIIEERRRIARALRKIGITIGQTAKVTELTEDEIKKL